MPETPPEWPLPKYTAPAKEYVHALGMISLNYNILEHAMFAIFLHHLLRTKVPRGFSEYLFGEFNDQQRVEAIREIYIHYEKNPVILSHIENLLSYFAWCAEARNLVLHSHEIPFEREASESLALMKRSRGDFSKFNFMQLSLPHLRAIADHMYVGYEYVVTFFNYLQDQAGLLNRQDKQYFSPTLPEKLQIPRTIKLQAAPATPEDDTPPPGSHVRSKRIWGED